jgi:hypothetical protein
MKVSIIVLLSVICIAFAQYDACTAGSAKGGVDLNKAALSSDATVFGRGFWDLIMNICKPVTTKCKDITGVPALWVFYNDPTNCNRISAQLNNNNDVKVEWIDTTAPEKGAVLKYNNGATFEQDGNNVASRAEIKIECDKEATDQKPSLDTNDVVSGVMVYKLSMKSKFACPDPAINPRGGGGGGAYAGTWPFGAGGIILSILLGFFIIYLIVGMLVMKFKFKATGIEIIPNVHFWKELPFLFKDGCLLIWDGVLRVTKKGKYQQLA